MINTILFMITAPIVLINILMVFTIMFGSDKTLVLPPLLFNKVWTNPTRWYIFYPTIFYQVWFWANYFNII